MLLGAPNTDVHLPPYTSIVTRVQISDDPVVLLVDTPGIMLPKLTDSAFAYRAVLAGLVDEKRVNLQKLFAFTLYVLGREPNTRQLRMVLARPLPDSQEQNQCSGALKQRRQVQRTGSRTSQSLPAVALRDAFGARRVAKCILQSLSDIADLRHQLERGTAFHGHSTTDDSVWPAGDWRESSHRSAVEECDLQPAVPGECLGNRVAEDARHADTPSGGIRTGMPSAEPPALPPEVGPRSAAHFLRLMETGKSPEPPSAQASVQVLEGAQCVKGLVECSPAQVHAAGSLQERPDRRRMQALVVHGGHTRRTESNKVGSRASAWQWEPFNPDIWQECGDYVIRRLLQTRRKELADQDMQVTSAMERVIRLTRNGALGMLLFEGAPSSGCLRGERR
jgi:hypothetical protein